MTSKNSKFILFLLNIVLPQAIFFKVYHKVIAISHTGKLNSSYIGMNVCGSAYENGCMRKALCMLQQ